CGFAAINCTSLRAEPTPAVVLPIETVAAVPETRSTVRAMCACVTLPSSQVEIGENCEVAVLSAKRWPDGRSPLRKTCPKANAIAFAVTLDRMLTVVRTPGGIGAGDGA